ncbi:hypothetical protein Ciccas_003362 [Cichlidogyrus casuarinus]|uniref:Sideroflexin-1 n=1 Tax=Cichlidogyrus casuarinus TaxID=1844966 RepID=A0ABD2QFI7_9PLAT
MDSYKAKRPLPNIGADELWEAKYVYESAFHPDTGQLINPFGRMACQMPANTVITGCLLTFYKTTPSVVFWQWFNQSYNAFVNYCNRSGSSEISPTRLGVSYILATSGALGTAFFINSKIKKLPEVVARLVPFSAVVAANFINLSCMRSGDLLEGIAIVDDEGDKVAQSKKFGRTSIVQVALSRISMCAPGMIFPPFLMDVLERRGFLARYPWSAGVIQTLMCGSFLLVTTPAGCAIWPQVKKITLSELEPTAQDQVKTYYSHHKKEIPRFFYYNKGL